jgi:glycosyltransferase involved in cell wall biosynthesis
MDLRAACAAVIPCLNEQAAIGAVVASVRQELPRIIVVDDGSTDDTAAICRSSGAFVLRNGTTLGKGAALQLGLAYARQSGCRWALTMDGDGQHSTGDISSFFGCAARTSAALIIGDRMGHASQIPFIRRWVNRWMSRRLSNLTGRFLPDSQCGFRLVNLDDWARMTIEVSYFEIESEMLFRFAKAGLAIEFVPIQVIYKKERSKIHPLRDTVRWLRWYARARRGI